MAQAVGPGSVRLVWDEPLAAPLSLLPSPGRRPATIINATAFEVHFCIADACTSSPLNSLTVALDSPELERCVWRAGVNITVQIQRPRTRIVLVQYMYSYIHILVAFCRPTLSVA